MDRCGVCGVEIEIEGMGVCEECRELVSGEFTSGTDNLYYPVHKDRDTSIVDSLMQCMEMIGNHSYSVNIENVDERKWLTSVMVISCGWDKDRLEKNWKELVDILNKYKEELIRNKYVIVPEERISQFSRTSIKDKVDNCIVLDVYN